MEQTEKVQLAEDDLTKRRKEGRHFGETRNLLKKEEEVLFLETSVRIVEGEVHQSATIEEQEVTSRKYVIKLLAT